VAQNAIKKIGGGDIGFLGKSFRHGLFAKRLYVVFLTCPYKKHSKKQRRYMCSIKKRPGGRQVVSKHEPKSAPRVIKKKKNSGGRNSTVYGCIDWTKA
jgi:hypothetical protein